MDRDRKGYLTLDDFTHIFAPETAKRAWEAFRITNEDKLYRGEMRQTLRAFYKDRVNLTASLNNFENLARVVQTLINFVFWVLMIVVVLVIFQYNVNSLLITFGTIMVSVSFALGAPIKNVVERYHSSFRFFFLFFF